MKFQFRPTFEIVLSESRETAVDKLKGHYHSLKPKASYLLFGDYGELHIPPSEYRLWTPHLSFCIAERNPEGQVPASIMHCRFAPRIEVWTFVWIVYLAMAFTSFFGIILVCSQWQLGYLQWGWALVLPPLLVILGLYYLANIGQQWSSDQMRSLLTRLRKILLEAEIHAGDFPDNANL